MTRRDWQTRRAGARHVPQRQRDRDARDRTARRSSTTRSCCCSTPTHEDREFTLPRRRLGARWELELSTAEPDAAAGQRGLRRPRRRCNVTAALDHDPQARRVSRHAPLRATYRLQLTPEFGFAAARELVPYLRDLGISHLYLSPVVAGPPGLDARLRRDRPDPGVRRARRRGRAAARWPTAAHAAGMGIVLDIVPNHMATDDANRFWADPGCASGSSTSTR